MSCKKYQKLKFDIEHIHIHTLTADETEILSYQHFGIPNIYMMSPTAIDGQSRTYSTSEIELFGYQIGVDAKIYLGLMDDMVTWLIFEKRAVNFKTDENNFL